jgi:CheY-like chemotaxis protein
MESIGSLASGIAHDLNNILTPIIMCAPLLKTEESAEIRKELAEMLESSANRAVGIVKQLLSFARGKEGQKQPIQIRHLVRDMAKLARETFPRDIRVQENCATDLWPVIADSTHIHQVLLNLCVNARDAMPDGGHLILRANNVVLDDHFVSMHPTASPGPHVRLEVQDTGTGIAESHQGHIFETFFTTKGEIGGTGLGLPTVQGIVKDHKGFVIFTTALGKGTTFIVHLPAVADSLADDIPRPAEVIQRGRSELVLVVDDETTVCETTRRSLERHGYRVLEAYNGIQGIAEFSAHRKEIQAVVTDYMMPLMDGATLCRALRALAPTTPIIISSGGLFGKQGLQAMQAFEELGIHHILHKPHTAEVLLRALAQVLGGTRFLEEKRLS